MKSQVLMQMFTLSLSPLIFVAEALLRREGNQEVHCKSPLVYIVYHNGVNGYWLILTCPKALLLLEELSFFVFPSQ